MAMALSGPRPPVQPPITCRGMAWSLSGGGGGGGAGVGGVATLLAVGWLWGGGAAVCCVCVLWRGKRIRLRSDPARSCNSAGGGWCAGSRPHRCLSAFKLFVELVPGLFLLFSRRTCGDVGSRWTECPGSGVRHAMTSRS